MGKERSSFQVEALCMVTSPTTRPMVTARCEGTLILISSPQGNIVYKGYWRDDQPHGEGIYKFRNGDTYHGNHDDGDYQGMGKFMCHDGSIYQGEWDKGKRSGKANFFDPRTGVATLGIWKEDKFEKYIDHKCIAQPGQGYNSLPLEEGFDWNVRKRELERRVHNEEHDDDHSPHDHHHHDNCNHYHDNDDHSHSHGDHSHCNHDHHHDHDHNISDEEKHMKTKHQEEMEDEQGVSHKDQH